MKKLLALLLCLIPSFVFGQIYIEKQTRHRFAQLTLGLDVETSFVGKSQYINSDGGISPASLSSNLTPRFLIGGTHFWGHADFYIAIPLSSASTDKDNQEITAYRGVETIFKYYPWRIEQGKIRPFIGTSLAPFYFEHQNNNFEYPNGPELNQNAFPLLGGITFNSKKHLFELGMAWNYANQRDYYISRDAIASITTPPIYTTLSYKYIIDTTLGAEKGWESGRTQEVTKKLAEQKRLNGFYIGAGLSAAFWLSESSYNQKERPYIEKYSTSIMLDITLGYYLNNSDINFAIGYRGYGTSTSTYGAVQVLNRKSFVAEATKYLFDYHGFVPFVGPAISYEKLSFNESFEGQRTIDAADNQWAYGLTFGWDIRPNRLQGFILRTNLRWYPNLFLTIDSESAVSFNNLEFNFIQLILYPNRIFKRK
ncbi:MAG: hypothetical protein AAFP19_17560 [Bacteroidota bacterium]